MDLSKLKLSDWVIGASFIVFFIASFLDWFTADISGGLFSVSVDGWDTDGSFFWVWIPLLLGIAMVAVAAIRAFSPQTQLPDLPIGWGQALFFAGVLAAALVLLKFILGEDAPSGVDVSRSIGIFLALLATIGLAVGGFLAWQDEKSGADAGNTPPTPF